ncbi:MAG TPA: DPP IV N-terminal domain-containing protein [Gemmatimonadaceae bacterium]|nr:DPP IV N-terminal domain-containing protein [Gemmatimonadaceae bacterium]
MIAHTEKVRIALSDTARAARTMGAALSLFAGVAVPASSQQPPERLTAADYARAERFLRNNVMPLVSGIGVQPSWLGGDRFWYRSSRAGGVDLVVVDPTRALRSVCSSETERCGAAIDANELSRARAEFGQRPVRQAPEIVSPDGKRAAFIRADNLWVRDIATGRETQLTTDGVKDFGYATDNAGWIKSDRPILVWSPDSRRIATFQQDQRGVGEMYLVSTRIGHPTLEAWKYPLPGDSIVTTIQRVIIDVDAPRVIRLQMPADQHRSTLCDHIICRGDEGWTDVQWYPDGSHVAFVSTSRDHKHEVLRVADASTGAVRDVLHEDVATQYESGNGMANWRVLPATNEVIWFSERDDWGQLYLYDLTTGQLKNKITTGQGDVAELLRVDATNRTLYFVGNGKEPGRDPYFRHFYKVGMNGKGLTLLTPENADHDIALSPTGRYFVDTYSRPDVPQISVLRDLNGKAVLTLEKADISRLLATGWKPPQPITVKARDGKTDLYGLLYTPTNLDSTKKYPIINHIYPGPQTGSVGSRSFSPARGDAQALAELGFVVVEIDGMGTPWRSKSFHDAYYARMGDNTLPDQVAGMKELAGRYRWIDIDRAGIYGHSGGGFAAADAMFRYPDFFKVGISEAGNHDQREYEDDWGERYQGLLVRKADGSDSYAPEANEIYAKNLKGKLLLAHGTMDNNVPPYNTLLVVNALIAANKDFDLILLPNRTHGFGNEPYMVRRRWDYFVENLLGAEPPKEYEIGKGASR